MKPNKNYSYYYNFEYSKNRGLVPFNDYEDIATKEEIDFLINYQFKCQNDIDIAILESPITKELMKQDDFIFYFTQYTNYLGINVSNYEEYEKEYVKFKEYFINLLYNNYLVFSIFFFSLVDKNKLELDNLFSFQCALMQAHQQKELLNPYGILLINLPPRIGKSVICHKIYCAWCIFRNPTRKIIDASISSERSETTIGSVSNIFSSDYSKLIFNEIILTSKRKNYLEFNNQGFIKPIGIRSMSATGEDSDLTIIDDINDASTKDNSIMYDNAISKSKYLLGRIRRSKDPDKVLPPIVLQQRTGKKDMSGTLINIALKDPQFKLNHICYKYKNDEPIQLVIKRNELQDIIYDIPAGYIREPTQETLNILRTLSNYEFQCQYQQNPDSVDESHFQFNYSEFDDENIIDLDYLITTTDFAWTDNINSNYNCICQWGIEYNNTTTKIANIYLLDIFYDKMKDNMINSVLQSFIVANVKRKLNIRRPVKRKFLLIEQQHNEGRILDTQRFIKQNLFDIELIPLTLGTTISSDNLKKIRRHKVDRIKTAQGLLPYFNFFIRKGIYQEKPYIINNNNQYQTKAIYIDGINEEFENYLFSRGKNNTDDMIDNISDIVEVATAFKDTNISILS